MILLYHIAKNAPIWFIASLFFESFVDNVLHKLSLSSQQGLTRFRLRIGGNNTIPYDLVYPRGHECREACRPNPEPARLFKWLSYPLLARGLRELDLSFHVRNPSQYKLPLGVFTWESLEALKLDSNVELDEIPVIRLPKLKLLHLHSFVFAEDDLVTKLVSNCPVLEDLSVTHCLWLKADRLIISSHSLTRMVLIIVMDPEDDNSDLVFIDTPNLLYLHYDCNLPYNYSIAHMNALVEAFIRIDYWLRDDSGSVTSFRIQLDLLRALSNVRHLSLQGISVEVLQVGAGLEDQLPVFCNLRTLDLSAIEWREARWDIVLLSILRASPLLEALTFSGGFYTHVSAGCKCDLVIPPEFREPVYKAVALEADGFRTVQLIPSCLQSHLKRITINICCGCDQELNIMKFLLGNASLLQEFVVSIPTPFRVQFDSVQFKKTVEEIPRASDLCSIRYYDKQKI